MIYCAVRRCAFFLLVMPPPPTSTLFPYTTLFRSWRPGSRRPEAPRRRLRAHPGRPAPPPSPPRSERRRRGEGRCHRAPRSEEHTSELQSQFHLVCRLLLEKKKRSTRLPPLPLHIG